MTTRAQLLQRIAISAAIAGLPTLWAAPANAVPLSNGLDVNCNVEPGTGVVCIIGGCPRVNGDYVVDAVHFNFNGTGQEEREFKCINGQTARAVDSIPPPPGGSTHIAVQGCRKKTVEHDWCGPWADYTFTVPAAAPKPAQPPGNQPGTSPGTNQGPAVPAGPPPVQCPDGSTVPAGQECPKPKPVTNAITVSFDGTSNTVFKMTVKNSSKLPASCNYEAVSQNPLVPSDTTRTFNVPANSSDTENFDGLKTGSSYKVTMTCTDSSGTQTEPLGSVNQTVKW